MVMIFKDTYEDLTPERLAEIIDEFEAGRGDRVTTGPQVDRVLSAPEGGLTSLKTEMVVKGSKASKALPPKSALGQNRCQAYQCGTVRRRPARRPAQRVKSPAKPAAKSVKIRPASPEKSRRQGR